MGHSNITTKLTWQNNIGAFHPPIPNLRNNALFRYRIQEWFDREIRNQVEQGILSPNCYDGFRMLRLCSAGAGVTKAANTQGYSKRGRATVAEVAVRSTVVKIHLPAIDQPPGFLKAEEYFPLK